MITTQTLTDELHGLLERSLNAGKMHVSVRWEPLPAVVRLGLMIEHYTWDARMDAISALTEFERVHSDDFAVEYDIVPLEAVTNLEYAEA